MTVHGEPIPVDLPPITQPFRADATHYVAACRIIAKHMTALADELDTLDSPFGSLSPVLPGVEHCCVCASAEVTYHNYEDKPFCRRCADGVC